MNYDGGEILDVYNDIGTVHDFRMFKESLVGVLPDNIFALLDSAYQGVHEYFGNALIPHKATKNNPLTDEQKSVNTMIAKLRVSVEHKIRQIKIFRICKETYRGKGERGLVRFKIIAALSNLLCFS